MGSNLCLVASDTVEGVALMFDVLLAVEDMLAVESDLALPGPGGDSRVFGEMAD